MAVILLSHPAGSGVYGTDAGGDLTSLPISGVQNEGAGLLFRVYEDGTGLLLATGTSSSTPLTTGPYTGYWPFTLTLESWVASVAIQAPGSSFQFSGGAVGLRGAPPLPGSSFTLSANGVTFSAGGAPGTVNIAGSSATFSGGSISGSGVVYVPGSSMTLSAGTLFIFVYLQIAGSSATFSCGDATFSAGGGPTAVSDDFNRANANNLGANWTQLSGASGRTGVTSNSAQSTNGSGTYPKADYWSADTFASDHYSEAAPPAAPSVAVRMQSAAHSCYYTTQEDVDYGEGYITKLYRLAKVVSGTPTNLGSYEYDAGGSGAHLGGVFRLEASGTTIALKHSTTHGGTFTTLISVTDSSLSGGAPGLYSLDTSSPVDCDNWYGGDL